MSAPDPAIEHALVMHEQVAWVGSRVKHYAQRWTGCATATVVGFSADLSQPGARRVHVKHDREGSIPDGPWDWDRTELAPDV